MPMAARSSTDRKLVVAEEPVLAHEPALLLARKRHAKTGIVIRGFLEQFSELVAKDCSGDSRPIGFSSRQRFREVKRLLGCCPRGQRGLKLVDHGLDQSRLARRECTLDGSPHLLGSFATEAHPAAGFGKLDEINRV